MEEKYIRDKGGNIPYSVNTMTTETSTEKLNLTIAQINELLRSLTNKSSLLSRTIEHDFDIYDLINFSLEGIFLPLLCLIGLTGC